jgi:hypothetical protein
MNQTFIDNLYQKLLNIYPNFNESCYDFFIIKQNVLCELAFEFSPYGDYYDEDLH